MPLARIFPEALFGGGLLFMWGTLPFVFVVVLCSPKMPWPLRGLVLIPTAGALCVWTGMLCFVARDFTGGDSYRGDMALGPNQLARKSQTIEVSSSAWQFQRWCDDHGAFFGGAGFVAIVLGCVAIRMYQEGRGEAPRFLTRSFAEAK